MFRPSRSLVVTAVLVTATTMAIAADTPKDVVLDRVTAPVVSPESAGTAGDAMAVSVLVESPDGTLMPRSTDAMFRTGDRFRVKLIASRDARVAIYNTNPAGVLSPDPIWRGEAKVGLDTISPRLRLDGRSGVDYMHIVMEPATPPSGPFVWLRNLLRSPKDGAPDGLKDIQLDAQNTPSATYVLNPTGQGIVTTMRIVHR